jgi:PIN domain
VKVLFDTSTLVPAIVVRHPQHAVCWQWLENARTDQIQGVVSTHTLAELYSVLTRLPGRPTISPAIDSAGSDLPHYENRLLRQHQIAIQPFQQSRLLPEIKIPLYEFRPRMTEPRPQLPIAQ